ncbi:LOW QUALITY PROTEIN: organic cation transporter protein-like [Dermacentor silvarum]|uniref:LOW QUALITY PROTEIN: organic cation transporter protein-like n=1 Tax=Dermacentor silvarum TaxID=543639 RepID=UPI002101CDB4|nr:LOW QUALITY PROTEIN: organic cation transporter protein-like [Dermacentor silvarum]
MEFEDVLEKLGGYGKFQKMLVWGYLAPASILMPGYFMSQIFMLSTPKHTCQLPDFVRASYNLTASEALVLGAALVSEDNCRVFPPTALNSSLVNQILNGPNAANGSSWLATSDIEWEPCERFEYDRTFYDNTASTQWDLICERNHLPSLVFTITSIGSALGTIFFGTLSDKIGRRFTFFITVVVATVFGISSILVTNFIAFIVLRFINATIMPQIFQIPYVILLELVGTKQRTAMLAVGWMSWTAGLCLLPLAAFLTRDWTVLGLMCSAAAALNAVYWKLLPESPRWLLSRDRFSEATRVLTRVAKTNGVCPPKSLANDLERVQRKLAEEEKVAKSSTADLMRMPKVRSNFLIITLSWVANAGAYYGMSINVTNMSGNEFVNFFLLALVEFPACVIAWWAMEKLGRRWMNVFFQFMVSASCIAFCLVPKEALVTGIVLVMLAKFSCTASAMVMYQQASEVMPTPVRSFALGASSSVASTITICMPYIIYLGKYGAWIPFAVIAMLATLGGAFSVWLPETRGYPLYQNMEDAQKFAEKQKFFSFNRRRNDQHPTTLDNQTNEKEMNLISNGCAL